jgi:hypothetical protein
MKQTIEAIFLVIGNQQELELAPVGESFASLDKTMMSYIGKCIGKEIIKTYPNVNKGAIFGTRVGYTEWNTDNPKEAHECYAFGKIKQIKV